MIRLAKQQSLNAIDTVMLGELMHAVEQAQKDGSVKIIVFFGEEHFSSGADITEMSGFSQGDMKRFSRDGQKLCNMIEDMDKLSIAVIEGSCVGGGFELASSCDIRIASKQARFGLPELRIGLVPGFGASYRIRRIIGDSRYRRLLFTGEMLDAEEAWLVGAVDYIEEDPKAKAASLIEGFSHMSYDAFKKAKAMMKDDTKDKVLSAENAAISDLVKQKDAKEGMQAFIEKRSPIFR